MRCLSPSVLLALVLLFTSLFFACGGEESPDMPGEPDAAVLRVWFHTGQPDEKAAMERQVARFNEKSDGLSVELTMLPEGSYHQQVQAAALSGDLPDLLEIDGPFVASYAWQQKLQPLEGLLNAELLEQLLPSVLAQGIYEDKLYAVGTFDSGLGIWGRRSLLEAAGVRIPSGYADAWSGAEFGEVLEKLAEKDEDGQVLDLGLQLSGEWVSYAFLPVIASAGGAVIDPGSGKSIHGLAGPRAQLAMTVLQAWIQSGRVDPNLDEQAFLQGRVALAWGGHWQYARYAESFGDDLVLLPLPNFGQGAKTGQGSWCWGLSKSSQQAEAAQRFLSFLLEDEQVLEMCKANGAVPATRSAIAKSELHKPGGALELFVQGLDGHAVPRPRTPAYPTVTSAFQEAFGNLRDGRPVGVALSRAASAIDAELKELGELSKQKKPGEAQDR
jgi:multiple sugar transport system substrate-binding protein